MRTEVGLGEVELAEGEVGGGGLTKRNLLDFHKRKAKTLPCKLECKGESGEG